jgi:hypothetical protein
MQIAISRQDPIPAFRLLQRIDEIFISSSGLGAKLSTLSPIHPYRSDTFAMLLQLTDYANPNGLDRLLTIFKP